MKNPANNFLHGILSDEELEDLYGKLVNEAILKGYKFPTKISSDGFYHIWVEDKTKKSGRKQIKASTIEILKNKVVEYEKEKAGIKRRTFKEVFDHAQNESLKYVKNKEKRYSVSNTVIRKNHNYIRFFSDTDFEEKYVDEITVRDIKDICLYNLTRYDLKKKSFDALVGIIRLVFKTAADEELIEEDISKIIDFHSPKLSNMLIPESDIADRLYTDEEIEKMIEYCHNWQKKYPKRPTAFALEYQILIGKRRGEVCPSKWSDIKTDKNGIRYIEISRELQEIKKGAGNPHEFCKIVEHTKTSMDRRVPIWDEMDEFLERLKCQHDEYYPDSDFMFPADTEFGCINIRTVYYMFHKMCKEIGVELSGDLIKGTHAFRRNFAKRVDDAEIASKLLGNDIRVLKKNYYDGLDMGKALRALNKAE